MNKAPIYLLLILIAALSFGKVSSFASESENVKQLRFNNRISIEGDSKLFEISGEEENKNQFRLKDNHNDEEREFKLKGTITASSSNSITIDGKIVNIDSSITEEVKIVGELEVGAYAIAKGVMVDSNLYAEQIVISQRNKDEIEEENENEIEDEDEINEDEEDTTVSVTPTPTITEDEDEDESATTTAQLDFGNIINTVQNFLNYLIAIASKI